MTEQIPVKPYILTNYDKYTHMRSKMEEKKRNESTDTVEQQEQSPSQQAETFSSPPNPSDHKNTIVEHDRAKDKPVSRPSSSENKISEENLEARQTMGSLIDEAANKLDDCTTDKWWQIL